MIRIPSIAGLVALMALGTISPEALFAAKPQEKKQTKEAQIKEAQIKRAKNKHGHFHHSHWSSSSSSSSSCSEKHRKAKSLVCDHASLSQQLLYPKTTPAPI